MRWWWVVLCFIGLAWIHDRSTRLHQVELNTLKAQLTALEKQRAVLRAMQDDLALKIQSQDDPRYVELVLRKELGLVPKGQIKVYFAGNAS